MRPLTIRRDQPIRTMPASRSTSVQHSASNSPSRAPVATPSMTKVRISGRGSAALSRAPACSRDSVTISTFGMLASSRSVAGFWAMKFHRTACLSIRCRARCTWPTVRGCKPPWLAVTAALAQELGVQIRQVDRLKRLELQAADGRQCVQLDQLPVALEGPLVAAEDDHRSEEHTSELQSRVDLVCRLLLEKKKKKKNILMIKKNKKKKIKI